MYIFEKIINNCNKINTTTKEILLKRCFILFVKNRKEQNIVLSKCFEKFIQATSDLNIWLKGFIEMVYRSKK